MSGYPELHLGIIGLSDGNGHPYSWSAIVNGYDPCAMAACPFPVIPAYLAARTWPEDRLRGARVTHVWTQDAALSSHIAVASRIPHVVDVFTDMLGRVDAVLLARDDAERHVSFARPFLEAGIPVYVDKPVALSLRELDALFDAAIDPWQIFSCSALRFSPDLMLTAEEAEWIGPVSHIGGVTPRSWAKYSPHVIDPVVASFCPGRLKRWRRMGDDSRVVLNVQWEAGCEGTFESTGENHGDISLTYRGARASVTKTFRDSFTAFRRALEAFLLGVRNRQSASSYEHLRSVVELIELGRT